MGDRFVHVGRLEMAAPKRKVGLREAYLKAGKLVQVNGKPFIQLSDANYQQIRRDFPPIVVQIAKKTGMPIKSIPAAARSRLPLGDMIHAVAGPIAKALKLPCVENGTTILKPNSPCAKRQQRGNEIGDKIVSAVNKLLPSSTK